MRGLRLVCVCFSWDLKNGNHQDVSLWDSKQPDQAVPLQVYAYISPHGCHFRVIVSKVFHVPYACFCQIYCDSCVYGSRFLQHRNMFQQECLFYPCFFSSEHQSCYQVPSTQWAAEDCVSKAQRLVDVAICSGLTVCEVRPTSKGKEQKKHVSAREQMIYVLGWKNWRFIFHSAYLAMGVVPTMRQSPSFKGEKEWDLQCPCPGVHWGYDTEVAWASGTRGHAPKSKCSMTRLHYLLFDTEFLTGDITSKDGERM